MRLAAMVIMVVIQLSGLAGAIPTALHQWLDVQSSDQPTQQAAVHINQTAVDVPTPKGNAPLNLGATAVYAVDADTMTILYAHNADAHLPIASITKMTTIQIILSRHSPSEVVTIKNLPAYDQSDALLGLKNGQRFTVGALVQAALVASDNDAADALAIFDAGSLTAFAARMNLTMKQWGILDTHFVSPEGLTDDNNYASARALAKIAKLLLANPLAQQLVRTTSVTIHDQFGAAYNLGATDDLLATSMFYGIKTGYTDAAGNCFVGITNISNHPVITVVLHSPDRFGESMALRSWIENNWQWL